MQLQNQNHLNTSTLNTLNYFLYMSVNAMNARETWRDYKNKWTIQRHKQHWAEGTEKIQQHR